ncbi:MAG TPA: ABC transporter substrate-binding protein [Candidatus Sulfomarinibacteraceae bacterium]|nr:ABC transporter substrate-binding protein [Candidatus Sulfomarinibacteraceae bacterium]
MQLSGSNFRLHNKRLLNLLSLLLILAFVQAACGGGAAESTRPGDDVPPVQETETPSDVEDTPTEAAIEEDDDTAEAEAVHEGVLRVAMQPIVQIDPAFISSDSEVLVANHVYDYLVDIDAQSNPVPRLATDWEISDDGLTYVFSLAEGVSWHNGDPFSAEDVVWTFDRLRDPDSDLPTVDLYSNIESVEATGDLQVTFTLQEANPFFLYDLSDNHALVVRQGTEDASDFNGTGPFVVADYRPEDRIVMEANEGYFVEGQPHLAGVEIIFFNDETAAIDALRSDQIDLAMRMSTSLFESLENDPSIITMSVPTNGFDLIRLRADREPGSDPRVIEALKLATDREAIFQLVEQGYGAVGNDSPIGPLYEAYHAPDVQPPPPDVEEARRLLEEAGYGDGLELTLHVPDTGNRPDLATVLQSQWADAGIDIAISVEPESVYYGDEGWLEVDLGITGWGSRPYPQFYLDVMLACDAVWNEAHFCDDELDQLIATAGSTLDEAERQEAYRQIQELLAQRGPIIIPYYFAQFGAMSDAFTGFELKAFAGRSDFRDVRLAQ